MLCVRIWWEATPASADQDALETHSQDVCVEDLSLIPAPSLSVVWELCALWIHWEWRCACVQLTNLTVILSLSASLNKVR